jgi:hypothetical protein
MRVAPASPKASDLRRRTTGPVRSDDDRDRRVRSNVAGLASRSRASRRSSSPRAWFSDVAGALGSLRSGNARLDRAHRASACGGARRGYCAHHSSAGTERRAHSGNATGALVARTAMAHRCGKPNRGGPRQLTSRLLMSPIGAIFFAASATPTAVL